MSSGRRSPLVWISGSLCGMVLLYVVAFAYVREIALKAYSGGSLTRFEQSVMENDYLGIWAPTWWPAIWVMGKFSGAH